MVRQLLLYSKTCWFWEIWVEIGNRNDHKSKVTSEKSNSDEAAKNTCMAYSTCTEFHRGKQLIGGFGRDAWLKGCTHFRIDVVIEHKRSKMHHDANASQPTKQAFNKTRGIFAAQFNRHDEAALFIMESCSSGSWRETLPYKSGTCWKPSLRILKWMR